MKETPLSLFLEDMMDGNRIVGVKESVLRGYAQNALKWERLAKKQSDTINTLKDKINKLENEIDALKFKETIEIINLYA